MLATRLARRVASCSRLRASAQQQRALSSTPTPRPPPDHHDAIGLPPPPHVEEAREPEAETHEAAEKHDEKPQPVEDKGPRRPIDFFPDIDEPDATTMAVARVPLPNPFPGDSSSPRKQRRHPFNTYTFVTVLEKASVPEGTAKTLMVGTRQLLNQRSERATSNMLSKEELENEAYLYKAALSKLRTEFEVRNRNAGIAARNAVTAVRRELESVDQRMAENVQVLKHDIELDLSTTKDETRAGLKAFDILIEEINNRATISVGDLKTEIESAKWEATRRAIAIIVVLVICGVGISNLTIGDPHVDPPQPKVEPPPLPNVTRDVGVGTDDDFDYEARIEKLLSSAYPAERKERKERERRERRKSEPEIYVDRI
ncbi:hypothetical protein A1Q2_02125 [Trichosporon asahii var. asahii CBS 8904]|uniref:Uncharacterized protein n=1 Tax=Trichosporon asahii var. asahii (strain CBS 8904) TaxID=1220162 RepID=K1VVP9_TRIAC|nr:hypothetical protein A1Q2_02125 [Trichosporon asahii var. asahii CBS 8904]